MPETFTLTKTAQTPNSDSFVDPISVTANSIERTSPSVAAAKSGTLSVRTDNDTGTCAMASGHGFVTSDKIDLFWSGGQRRGMTATVTGDSAVLDGGTGDNLPAAATAITACKPTTVPFEVDGDSAIFVAAKSDAPGFVLFLNIDAEAVVTVLVAYSITVGGYGKSWISGDGTNPIAETTVTHVRFSHGATIAKTMVAAVGFN